MVRKRRLLTPEQVHFENWKPILENRQRVLADAVDIHPERFVKGVPQIGTVPQTVWINKPRETEIKDYKNNKLVLSQTY